MQTNQAILPHQQSLFTQKKKNNFYGLNTNQNKDQ